MRRIWAWLWAEKKKWRGVGACGLALFGVGGIVSVEVTSTPNFCGSCHIMDPYYDSWKTSAHKDVTCVKCHIEPGMESYVHAKLNGLGQVVDDLLSRTSFKPSASVTALSCTRSGCHTTETLAGKTIDNGRFKFRHDKHLGRTHLGVEISCGTCHSHVMGDEHFEVNTTVCITCHLTERDRFDATPGDGAPIGEIRMVARTGLDAAPDGTPNSGEIRPPSNCRNCHDAPTEIIQSGDLTINHAEFLEYGASCESCHRHTTAAPQPIEDGRCIACHTFGVEKTLPVEEMHRVHALGKHKIECFSCHGVVQHGLTAQAMTLEQFDCRKCHIDQHSAQRDAYLLAADMGEAHPETPAESLINPMFLAHVDCTGCHTRSKAHSDSPMDRAEIRTASAESCDQCHKPGMGEQMIPLWQNSTRKLYERATARLESIDLTSLSAENSEKVREAEALLDLVRLDGSWGVHNPKYTEQLLERALGKITEVLNGSAGSEG